MTNIPMHHHLIPPPDLITIVDIGCRGGIDDKWRPLAKNLAVIGFDMNKDECRRLTSGSSPYKSSTYLPYAIGGAHTSKTLYKTADPFCWSLLKSNTERTNRLAFQNSFRPTGSQKITSHRLDEIPELINRDIDILKIDSQGLELPILLGAKRAVRQAFYIEVETGFVDCYIGESVYAEVDNHLRKNGFLLFDMNANHRIPRNNKFSTETSSEQILWCETIWLKDYVSLHKQNKLPRSLLTRPKALRALTICAAHGCISYGYELAQLCRQLHLISGDELAFLSVRKNWNLQEGHTGKKMRDFIKFLLNVSLRLLPHKARSLIKNQAEIAEHQNGILHF